ncbi:MAG: toll/interleukin-1 receptor domain-containing protein [Methanothrix sp.]|nr:toll/interleukin-1 receptor domain-containing protein [Methanothrix sp.]MDD4448814.1 toll/interleukin-1 receptor domain-containing protein [Methanothrix sp.]
MQKQQFSDKPAIFISHRGEDIALAERLATQLKQAGFEVWLDKWDIGIGDSIVGKINAGLENARYLILCYSEAGVLSSWMSCEWMATLGQQLNGYEVKVLPVRLSGGNPPAIMADIKYADLVKDWDNGMVELLNAMGR